MFLLNPETHLWYVIIFAKKSFDAKCESLYEHMD